MLVLEPPSEDDWAVAANRARMHASTAIQARIDGQAGAFAAALMTGDRSGISAATNDSMRASNLFHIISISGLHMGMLAGFVFATLRYGLALVPALALRLPVKKLAAGVALLAASAYLWLAGPNVATERAYVMAAVMLVAVLVDRRAISLRSIAVAAVILLLRKPESLTDPGFQMSFGATAALILAWGPWQAVQGRVPALLRPVAALTVSSLAASMATAPIAAAHFNRMAEYGLLANLLAVPVMGTLVMPAGVIAAVLAPLGLAGLPLWIMEIGCLWILWVSDWVAGLDGAVVAVPSPPGGVLALMAAGALLAVLARGAPRWIGAGGVVLSAVLWAGAARPPLLVSADGMLLGLLGPEGRALSQPRGAGYVADSWLEDDGDLAEQDQAAARPGFTGPKNAREAMLAGVPVRQLTGKTAPEALPAACADGALVILAGEAPEGWGAKGRARPGASQIPQHVSQGADPDPDCDLWDSRRLRRSGALAIWPDGAGGLRIVTARDISGTRLWNNRR
ncbi:ComEC/Rec2-related protein [Frigidibacter mobilis]|uniref:ComEC/Rec2-related protein n=1 Tax=Frigidibacter mobilis TaxID=1335048 RepID=A0A159Z2J6_9RHOB|nr:ComEC/Rec2-related protein [Frigidibacter mobilis]